MSKTLEEFLEIIPEKYRSKVILKEEFKGNRTNISFEFTCGCIANQSLKAFLLRDNFDYCTKCKNKFCEKYLCEYCQTEFIQKGMFEQCKSKCEKKYKLLEEGVDFVICEICGFHAKSLGVHLNFKHSLKTKEYIKKFPGSKAITDNSSNNYSKSAIENGSWLVKAIENGDDLTEYWEKVSKGVRESIMSNPEERERRAKVMAQVNQSDLMRQKASETAKKTSSRPEILEARSQQLEKWRQENPDDFYNKCVVPMLLTFQSKPEKKLFDFVNTLEGFSFNRNQRVKSITFLSITKEKQIDMADKDKRIYIEFDGILHFEDKFKKDTLSLIKEKDYLLNNHIINHNWMLIRISYDQFIYKTKMIDKIKTDASYFKQECLDEIVKILTKREPGIYKIGEAYGKY